MSDLVAFLRARYDEETGAARIAAMRAHEHWMATPSSGPPAAVRSTTDDGLIAKTWPEQAEHIARWDPARVLAEVAAKRAILDAYTAALPDTEGMGAEMRDIGYCEGLEHAIELHAQSYTEHPHFHPSWAIEPTAGG